MECHNANWMEPQGEEALTNSPGCRMEYGMQARGGGRGGEEGERARERYTKTKNQSFQEIRLWPGAPH
jgi:hypothetical protein